MDDGADVEGELSECPSNDSDDDSYDYPYSSEEEEEDSFDEDDAAAAAPAAGSGGGSTLTETIWNNGTLETTDFYLELHQSDINLDVIHRGQDMSVTLTTSGNDTSVIRTNLGSWIREGNPYIVIFNEGVHWTGVLFCHEGGSPIVKYLEPSSQRNGVAGQNAAAVERFLRALVLYNCPGFDNHKKPCFKEGEIMEDRSNPNCEKQTRETSMMCGRFLINAAKSLVEAERNLHSRTTCVSEDVVMVPTTPPSPQNEAKAPLQIPLSSDNEPVHNGVSLTNIFPEGREKCQFVLGPNNQERVLIAAEYPPCGSKLDNQYDNETSRCIQFFSPGMGFVFIDLVPHAPLKSNNKVNRPALKKFCDGNLPLAR